MSPLNRRQAGFTILELAIVLIVIGILAAALIPMSQSLFGSSMNKTDQKRLDAIQNAMLGYARINQGLPCFNAAGLATVPTATTGCDVKQTLAQLGVRDTDARGQSFVYDVNPTLTTAYIQDHSQTMCAALGYLINPQTGLPGWPYGVGVLPPLYPEVCAANATNTGTQACQTAATPQHPTAASMAFVLVGKGGDRCLNLQNTTPYDANKASCLPAAPVSRIYENPARVLHTGNDTINTGTAYYDDIVVDEPLSNLAEEMGCGAGSGSGTGGAGLFCPNGETLVDMVNGSSNTRSIEVNGKCYVVSGGTSSGAGCQQQSSSLKVSNGSSCSGGQTYPFTTNGVTTILCPKTGACTVN